MQFEAWPLHDAVLREIRIDWPRKVCQIRVAAFTRPGFQASLCILTWRGVTSVVVPSRAPWGTIGLYQHATNGRIWALSP